MAIREIAATARDVLGVEPSSLVISDDTGRVVSRRTEASMHTRFLCVGSRVKCQG
jgi:hypothetical protein